MHTPFCAPRKTSFLVWEIHSNIWEVIFLKGGGTITSIASTWGLKQKKKKQAGLIYLAYKANHSLFSTKWANTEYVKQAAKIRSLQNALFKCIPAAAPAVFLLQSLL